MNQYEFEESQITDTLKTMLPCPPDKYFGPVQALLSYGQIMATVAKRPSWMVPGTKRECYANCVKALISQHGLQDGELSYAEGYAKIKDTVWLPVQHAWLVDSEGRVIDPTWEDASNHVYFGVSFKTSFVLDMLEKAELVPELLVTPELMCRYFGSAQLFKSAICERHDLTSVPRDRMFSPLSWQAPFPQADAAMRLSPAR